MDNYSSSASASTTAVVSAAAGLGEGENHRDPFRRRQPSAGQQPSAGHQPDEQHSGQRLCHRCGKRFVPRLRYQTQKNGGATRYICSPQCLDALQADDRRRDCSACGRSFLLSHAFQVGTRENKAVFFCSLGCRESHTHRPSPVKSVQPRRLAVFNHKGGTGKTTTAVSLAMGLADSGRRVLLIDADAQGNVGSSLGISGQKNLYHVLTSSVRVSEAVVPVREDLDVLTSNELLAAAEMLLVGRSQRDRRLSLCLAKQELAYDYVIIDCAPALSLMNQNALVYADQVVVPVSCDYLALVGVQQVLRTLKHIHDILRHPIRLFGVLPTFFDARSRMAIDSLATLRRHFGERCLQPIRVNSTLKEAPACRKSIFELAPHSRGAHDYRTAVSTLLAQEQEPAAVRSKRGASIAQGLVDASL